MSDFDQAIQEHIYLYKEGIQDKYYQGAKWAWQHQQAIIDDLKAQLNNMETCYIEKKKQVEAVDAVLMNWRDEYMEHTHQHECTVDSVLRTCITELEQALRGTND